MSNGEKKIIKCSSCSKAFDVTTLKPGVKFKCSQCDTINTVPGEEPVVLEEVESAAPSQPSSTPPQPAAPPPTQAPAPTAPPAPAPAKTVRPAAKPAMRRFRPGASTAKKGSRYSRLGKAGKSGKLGRRKPGAEDEAAEGEEEFVEPQKSKTPLIIGIMVGLLIVVVLIFLLTSKEKEPVESEEAATESLTEESAEAKSPEPEPKPKKPDLKTEWEPVNSTLKQEMKGFLQALKDAPNMAAASQIKMDIINKGEAGMAALIEIFADEPDSAEFKHLCLWLTEFTGKEFVKPRGVRKPYTNTDKAKNYQDWWLNKSTLTPEYKYPPDKLVKELEKEIKGEGTPVKAATPSATTQGFEVNEEVRNQVLVVLDEIADYRKGDDEWEAGAKKIMDKGKDAIPALILEIANDSILIGFSASELLIKWTKRAGAPTFTPLAEGMKLDVSKDWQQWWKQNKDKY